MNKHYFTYSKIELNWTLTLLCFIVPSVILVMQCVDIAGYIFSKLGDLII